MPNFARILANILLYIFYVVVIAFLLGFVIPLVYVSFGREIPVFSSEVYNMIFFIIAGLVFLITLLLRRSCYLSLKEHSQDIVVQSYTHTKKQETQKQAEKKNTTKTEKIDKSTGDDESIKIYVDKEIR